MPYWRRASLRWLLRHPWQLGLAFVGVALGVAVMIAVDLAASSAARAFELSMARVIAGATHRIVGPPAGFDEEVYRKLRIGHGVRASAPIVEGFAELEGETLRVLGVDPFAMSGAAPGAMGAKEAGGDDAGGGLVSVRGDDLVRLLTRSDTAVLAATTARRHGIEAGDTARVAVAGTPRAVEIVGLIGADGERPALDGLMVVDIATAQGWFHRLGRLDYINLDLGNLDVGAARAAAIAAWLPPGLAVEPASSRTRQAHEMTAAFRVNLTAMGLLAVVVGVFLIYNTMAFAVVQRRRLIGTLRALGVTRRQVYGQVVLETLALGLAGTLVGLAAGVVLAHGLVGLVTRTINDLYFVLTVREVFISPATLAQGAAIGLGAALIAALGPAAEAAAAPPDAAGRRSVLEHRARRAVPVASAMGLAALVATGLLVAWPGGGLLAGFAALALLIVGAALLIPAALIGLIPPVAALCGRIAGPLGQMAARGITASLSRTALAVIALAVALSATVGVGVMVDSFRGTVARWLERSLTADLYLSAPGQVAARYSAPLPEGLTERLRGIEGVAALATGWRVEVRVESEAAESGAAQSGATPMGLVPLLAVEPAPGYPRGVRLKAGDPASVWRRFQAGEAVLVTETFASEHGAGPGDAVRLRTDRGLHAFEIAGVYYDYNTDRGVVRMHRDLYSRWWGGERISSIGVFLADDAAFEAVADRIRAALAGGAPVRMAASARIRERSLAVFDRTFAITSVLRTLALAVAFVGVLTALLALEFERERELAILRATGATPGQVRAQVFAQTGILGLLAGLLALPLGLALSQLLIHVINRRAFGWSIETAIDPVILAQALALAIGAALLAGAWPAWRAGRVEPASALRGE